MEPIFFESPAAFRKWLDKNHAKETEVLVGFHKTKTGKPTITWPESVDQALCFGWIDGVRKSIDEHSYTIRFTPRKTTSIWSAINIKKVEDLTTKGLMKPAGLEAFKHRKEHKSKIYSFEQDREKIKLEPAQEQKFRSNKKAWKFFTEQSPSYQRTATWVVISAKQEATREKRLDALIADSEAGLLLKQLRRPEKK
ncbi:YdeI/OmpD-associated family protein [Taibaiella soli]|uniref:Bacteriocin-protection protein n=1 Tax=Taibaiella soli TaxID=1649169 RepID=A0A2W2AMI8_9BACT|nr:YdeI/OmpD-associated family protein [Taibaiella soli]PZF73530.1 bacteriocin-protection protein [Taibaiella soli]